jgi:hypothetical protein
MAQTKVCDPHVLSDVDKDVFGFDITVNDSKLVQSVDAEGLQSRRRQTLKTREDNHLLVVQPTCGHVGNSMQNEIS